jgi:hypothetical protein
MTPKQRERRRQARQATPLPVPPVASLSDEDLKKLADDIRAGRVFTSAHLSPGEERLLPSVFMPLAFMSAEQRRPLQGAGLAYEYLDRAAPRSINGCPMFFSVRFLNVADTSKVFAIVRAIDAAVAGVKVEG